MAFTERKPGSRWRAGLLTTGARVVPDGRFGRTGAGVADERGAASRAGGRNVSLLALGAIGGTPVAGAGALATGSRLGGDAGIDEMPSHAAPPPSATSRPAAAAASRPLSGFAGGSQSASTSTTGVPGPFFSGFAPDTAVRASGRGPPRAATKSSTRSEERRVGKECRSRWGQEH